MVSWTISKGERYLGYIKPLLDRCGFRAEIVGGVVNRGYSDNDLDVVLYRVRPRASLRRLSKLVGGNVDWEEPVTMEVITVDGPVDFQLGD